MLEAVLLEITLFEVSIYIHMCICLPWCRQLWQRLLLCWIWLQLSKTSACFLGALIGWNDGEFGAKSESLAHFRSRSRLCWDQTNQTQPVDNKSCFRIWIFGSDIQIQFSKFKGMRKIEILLALASCKIRIWIFPHILWVQKPKQIEIISVFTLLQCTCRMVGKFKFLFCMELKPSKFPFSSIS